MTQMFAAHEAMPRGNGSGDPFSVGEPAAEAASGTR